MIPDQAGGKQTVPATERAASIFDLTPGPRPRRPLLNQAGTPVVRASAITRTAPPLQRSTPVRALHRLTPSQAMKAGRPTVDALCRSKHRPDTGLAEHGAGTDASGPRPATLTAQTC